MKIVYKQERQLKVGLNSAVKRGRQLQAGFGLGRGDRESVTIDACCLLTKQTRFTQLSRSTLESHSFFNLLFGIDTQTPISSHLFIIMADSTSHDELISEFCELTGASPADVGSSSCFGNY